MKVLTLFEVICIDQNGCAFGATFGQADGAKEFADACKAKGWTVEPSPEFCTYGTVEAAMADAMAIFRREG